MCMIFKFASYRMEIMNIWIVDDDHIYVYAAQKQLALNMGIKETVVLANGKIALDALRVALENNDTLPQIILLDINMPVLDGWEFMEAFNAIENEAVKSIAIFMVSSSIYEEDTERAKNYPQIKDYIQKPLNTEKIQRILKFMNR